MPWCTLPSRCAFQTCVLNTDHVPQVITRRAQHGLDVSSRAEVSWRLALLVLNREAKFTCMRPPLATRVHLPPSGSECAPDPAAQCGPQGAGSSRRRFLSSETRRQRRAPGSAVKMIRLTVDVSRWRCLDSRRTSFVGVF